MAMTGARTVSSPASQATSGLSRWVLDAEISTTSGGLGSGFRLPPE